MRVSSVVEEVLKQKPKTRNSDKELQLRVWEKFGLHLTLDQQYKFVNLPSTETIRRIRQKLQEEGKYLSDKKIAAERRFKGYRMQQMNPRSDKIENITEHAVSWLED